jgi:hypothetical protein
MSESFDAGNESRVSCASRAQLRANRRNAKRSTGPRSDRGKTRAARNAITHGLYCRDLILPGERMREFLALRLAYHCDLKATDAIEFAIVERAVIAQWHLKRAQAAEAQLHGTHARRVARRARRRIERLRVALGDPRYDVTDEDKAATARRRAKIAMCKTIRRSARVPAATTLAIDFARGGGGGGEGALERLSRQEHRLEHHFYKALRELRAYRKDKRDSGINVSDAEPYADIAQMTQELLACEPQAREQEREQAREDEAAEETANETESIEPTEALDDNPRGVVASACNELSRVATTCSSNVQNEPNSPKTLAGDEAPEGCEQRSCNIERMRPAKLAPPSANQGRDEGKEARDRS